ncbi:hypothetical protein HYQ45_005536 [Verticillium longisporum]|uniref:Secreted protein n=1 Tax=Verticillium longisporum TaxID=100787 RepID=A0A8I3AWV9_VERLO|nr:hypothetical protein HYQ45_005536 [Verticillium longisporum]
MCTRFGPPRVLRPSPLPLLLLLHPLPLFRPTVTTSHGPTTSELVQAHETASARPESLLWGLKALEPRKLSFCESRQRVWANRPWS